MSDRWTDLGAGPLYLEAVEGPLAYVTADAAPDPGAGGFALRREDGPVRLDTTAHVYARAVSGRQGVAVGMASPGAGAPALPTDAAGRLTVGGRTAIVTAGAQVTAGAAYAPKNQVGGKLTFAGPFDAPLTGTPQSVAVVLRSAQTAGFELHLFSADPSATPWADKTSPAIAASDATAHIGAYALAPSSSALGAETIYGLDGIGAIVYGAANALYGEHGDEGDRRPGAAAHGPAGAFLDRGLAARRSPAMKALRGRGRYRIFRPTFESTSNSQNSTPSGTRCSCVRR